MSKFLAEKKPFVFQKNESQLIKIKMVPNRTSTLLLPIFFFWGCYPKKIINNIIEC